MARRDEHGEHREHGRRDDPATGVGTDGSLTGGPDSGSDTDDADHPDRGAGTGVGTDGSLDRRDPAHD